MLVTVVMIHLRAAGAGHSDSLLVLPPPVLVPPPQSHRHLHRLVVGRVDGGHTLDRHPRPLNIDIVLAM